MKTKKKKPVVRKQSIRRDARNGQFLAESKFKRRSPSTTTTEQVIISRTY